MSPDQRGFSTLLKKEIMRFWAVLAQTVTAPVITALLYLLVFAQALQGRSVNGYDGLSYTEFLVPGLVMMTVIQNAFANTSSSLIQSKVMGNIVFTLMAPLGPLDWFGAYVIAALVRSVLVALAMLAVTWFFVPLPVREPGALLAVFTLSAATLAALGLIAGILAQKFDHIAAFTNFFITPLSFLSGVFYSVHSLPPFWFTASHFNPFFYMIDGFRYGFFGQADVPIFQSLLWIAGAFVAVSAVALWMLVTGYKMRR
ncbi:MAG: metal-dependent hydrolase [Nevskiaceae bacterium]|nr:MAG: metal-dependent hydrolase [Nevskiaceae bacterium]TAM33931.1 MAG: metal-dependent hydrolase [Nevskiaceae bacterium]